MQDCLGPQKVCRLELQEADVAEDSRSVARLSCRNKLCLFATRTKSSPAKTSTRAADEAGKMAWNWHENVTLLIVAIALSICFGWVPVVAVISLVHNGKRRFRSFFEERGWVAPVPDEEKRVARLQKAPEIQKPPPVVPRGLERSASTRTHASISTYDPNPLRRWETGSSWDPIRRWDTSSTADPTARNNSLKSNYSRGVPPMPMPSRASSIRSVASMHQGPGSISGRSRRGSVSSVVSGSPGSYQVETAYYDTTPLPQPPIAHASNFTRPMSAARPRSSGSTHRRVSSLDHPKSPPGRKSEDYSRSRTPAGEEPIAIPMSRRTPPPRRASLNAATVQTMQHDQAPPWWEDSPPLPHAM